jgi:hypothetical protein
MYFSVLNKGLHMSNFKQLELLFSELLGPAESRLSKSEREEIREFVDVGEYGIALRTAVGIFYEEKKVPTELEKVLLRQLAEGMLIEPEALLRRLDG